MLTFFDERCDVVFTSYTFEIFHINGYGGERGVALGTQDMRKTVTTDGDKLPCHCIVLLRIDEIFRLDVGKDFVEIASGILSGLFEIHERPVAAVSGTCAGNFTFKVGHKVHRVTHEVYNIGAFKLTLNDEIVAGAASHRPPVDYAVFPLGIVAQISGRKVFERMERFGSECGLAVWLCHAHVKGGYDVARWSGVAA